MSDLLDETIFLFLKCMIPAAYLISNKTVLTLHNFRFPSIFLSWQLAIAITGLFFFYRKCFDIRSVIELRYYVSMAFLQTSTLYFGSRALSVLPVPVFVAGQITGLYFVNIVNQIRLYQTNIKWTVFQAFNSVLILPLFVMVCVNYSEIVLIQFVLHIVSNTALTAIWRYNQTYDVLTEVKSYIVTFGISVILLVVYGTFSREIFTAAKFDFSKTHFKVYLFTSGMLCATLSITRLSSGPSDIAHKYVDVLQYVLMVVLGYLYQYNGDAISEHSVCFYFIFLLWTNKYLQSYPALTEISKDTSITIDL